jgi:hypothetical protein
MRILLAILVTAGLILNSGSGFMAAAYAKASLDAKVIAHAHHAASPDSIHADGKEAGDCHKHSSNPPANGCKCCEKNAKCTHGSCHCLKCFSALANVRPASHTFISLASLFGPEAFDKPPGGAREPPPPPPQS